MAILRQIALLPRLQEIAALKLLRGRIEVRQEPPIYGNLPTSLELRCGDGSVLISSSAREVVYKFECISLRAATLPHDAERGSIPLKAALSPSTVEAVFRADWLKPLSEEGADATSAWSKVTMNLAAVESLPTKLLSGCLTLTGLLFLESKRPIGLVYLDDFPLSVGFTQDPEEIARYLENGRVVHVGDIATWSGSLVGWETHELSPYA